jgi:hypothetical protein
MQYYCLVCRRPLSGNTQSIQDALNYTSLALVASVGYEHSPPFSCVILHADYYIGNSLHTMAKGADANELSHFERCPPEILSRIFVLVCTDGGRMGGVLRLVSRRIRTQVKPYRFWSVHVASTKQLQAFERAILKVGASLRRVQHLMISDRMAMDSQGSTLRFGYTDVPQTLLALFIPGTPDTERAPLLDYNMAEEESRAEFEQTLARTHGHVAMHLKSFTLVLFGGHYTRLFEGLRSRTFPRLTHFALYHKPCRVSLLKPFRMPSLLSFTFGGPHWAPHQAFDWARLLLSSCDALEVIEIRGLTEDQDTRKMVLLLGKPALGQSPTAPSQWINHHHVFYSTTIGSLSRFIDSLSLRYFNVGRQGGPAVHDPNIREFLIQEGVDVHTDSIFPTYRQLREEWTSMLEEKALDYALA